MNQFSQYYLLRLLQRERPRPPGPLGYRAVNAHHQTNNELQVFERREARLNKSHFTTSYLTWTNTLSDLSKNACE